MIKEFVPYELAVKLKELGFNDQCFSYYDLNNKPNFFGADGLMDTHCVQVNRPTFSQAFRWFREKGFFVSFSTRDYNIYDFYVKWSMPNSSTLSESILSDTYDTYEETELACLTKLIEIVETRTK